LHLLLLRPLQGIYTPSKIDGGHVIAYENGLANTTGTLLKGFNESLLSFEAASSAGVLSNLAPAQWQELNETVAGIAGDNRDITATRGNTASECTRTQAGGRAERKRHTSHCAGSILTLMMPSL
jgi:hypothetical protein